MHHYLTSLQAARRMRASALILDRAWLSESIYGAAFRGGLDRIGSTRRRMLERFAMSLRAVVVLAAPRRDLCVQAWENRKEIEMLKTQRQLLNVYDGYAQLLEKNQQLTELPVIHYDYEQHDAAWVLAEIKRVQPPRNQGPGIGLFKNGQMLIVGDEPSKRGHLSAKNLVFISDHDGGCSAWMTDQLEKWKVPERDLYWINSRSWDGLRTSDKFLSRLQPSRVVALGKRAKLWCSEAGIENAVEVPHPQYWKRFRAHEFYPLREALL